VRIETIRLYVPTDDGASLADVTADVNQFVQHTAIRQGLCILTLSGDHCCLTLSPELDEDVDDLFRIVRAHLSAPREEAPVAEPASRDRLDVDDSGYPASGVLADSITVSVREGAMNLGTWEAVVVLDGDGPRTIPLDVTLVGA
jgi:thiamine phosphate synthase YjbQ (UPF0047 family)